MKRLICICLATILLAAVPAMAQLMTGNQLKNWADIGEKSPDFWDNALFLGYVTGVAEGTCVKRCNPPGVTNEQFLAVVRKYLKDYPEKLHLPASDLVTMASQTAWPCPK